MVPFRKLLLLTFKHTSAAKKHAQKCFLKLMENTRKEVEVAYRSNIGLKIIRTNLVLLLELRLLIRSRANKFLCLNLPLLKQG